MNKIIIIIHHVSHHDYVKGKKQSFKKFFLNDFLLLFFWFIRTSSNFVFIASRHDHLGDFFCKGSNQVLRSLNEVPLLQGIHLQVLCKSKDSNILWCWCCNITCDQNPSKKVLISVFWGTKIFVNLKCHLSWTVFDLNDNLIDLLNLKES